MAELEPCISGQTHCGWDKAQTYTCVRCEKEHCYCFGASDATPALCDSCAVFIQDLWGPVSSAAQPVALPAFTPTYFNDPGDCCDDH